MATRLKKKLIENVTLEQAQQAADEYCSNETQLKKIEAWMNEEINKVKSKYKSDVTKFTEALEQPAEILQVYAQEQKESWGKKKSHDLLHCTIGFRTGTPKVCKKSGFTWDAVQELVRNNKILSKLFIRQKHELNKEAILANKDTKMQTLLKEVAFVTVEQEECFFVEAKAEELIS